MNTWNIKTNERRDLKAISFIRFIAFMNIFLLHSQDFSIMDIRFSAKWAVSLFIILSGYLTGYANEKYSTGFTFRQVREYMVRKVVKVYPLFFVTTIIAIPLYPLLFDLSSRSFHALGKDVGQLIQNLLFLQSWSSEGYFSYNGVTWFLSTIFFLYLLTFPLMAFLKRLSAKKHGVYYLIAVFATVFAMGILWAFYVEYRQMDTAFYLYILPLARIPEYLCGILAGFLMDYFRRKNIHLHLAVATALEVASMGVLYVLFGFSGPEWVWKAWGWILPSLMFIMVFSFGDGVFARLFSRKVPRLLGEISMECFLIHQVLIAYFTILVGKYEFSKLGNLGCQLFLLGTTLIMALYLGKKGLTSS